MSGRYTDEWVTVYSRAGTIAQRRTLDQPPPDACRYCKGATTVRVTDSYFNLTVDMQCVDCGGTGHQPHPTPLRAYNAG
ncbi:hypothetical protein [Streptomyces noursei]